MKSLLWLHLCPRGKRQKASKKVESLLRLIDAEKEEGDMDKRWLGATVIKMVESGLWRSDIRTEILMATQSQPHDESGKGHARQKE